MNEIFKTTVVMTPKEFIQVQYYVDHEAISQLSRTVLGKTILFTDNHEWTDEQIVRAYRAQYHIEHAFREMKNPHFLGWNPRFHWTDQKIRVHAFYCVAALTLVSLIRRDLKNNGLSLSTESLMKNLNGIRETISVHPQESNKPPKLSHSISRLNETQKKLYDLLRLHRFRHKQHT
jgi:transposase